MAHLGEVQERMLEISAAGGRVLAISFADAAMACAYQSDHHVPFPVAADPDRMAYQAFAVGRGNRRTVWRPSAILQHIWLRVRGFSPGRHRQEDLLQLGGDFVIGSDGRLKLCHPSSAGDDRAPVSQILIALQAN